MRKHIVPEKVLKPLLMIFLILIFMPIQVSAEGWTPFQFSIWNPIQLFPKTKDVYGLRFNLLYGENTNVTGIDLGGCNAVVERQNGLQLGLINASEIARGIDAGLMNYTHDLKGIQMGIINTSQDKALGIQTGVILNSCEQTTGLQIHAGIVGNASTHLTGGQIDVSVPLLGFNYADFLTGIQIDAFGFNFVSETFRGVQIAPYNTAGDVYGVQIGIFNFCDTMHGVQIGLLNMINRQKPPFMPIINVGF